MSPASRCRRAMERSGSHSLGEVSFDLVQPRFARLPVRSGEVRAALDFQRLLPATREGEDARAPRPEIGGLGGEAGDIRRDEPE